MVATAISETMKVLELFAGYGDISKAFRELGGAETFTVDLDNSFDVDLHLDIEQLTTQMILDQFGIPDIVWVAPCCKTYSLAAISKHRTKNNETGNLDPISDYAKKSDSVNIHVIQIIKELHTYNPDLIVWAENPRACLQNMVWMKEFDKYKHLVTYCKYQTEFPPEQRTMKPTNLWTNIPDPKLLPPCKNGEKDHAYSPRGSKHGIQGIKGAKERSRYPKQLINHIVNVSLEYYQELKK